MLGVMKPVVILDTNALRGANGRKPLTRPDTKMILELSRSGSLRLLIPEVVLLELSRQWAEDVAASAVVLGIELKKINEALAEIGAPPKSLTMPTPGRTDLYDFAHGLFLAKRAEVPAVPEVPLSTLLARELDIRKPFARDGKGFRDALIWETIREFCGGLKDPTTPILFVTNNHSDFCEPKTRELHSDLRQALRPDQHFEVVTSLHDLRSHSLIRPLREDLEEVQAFFNRERVEELVDAALSELHGADVDQAVGIYQGDGYYALPIISALDSPTFDEIMPENNSITSELFRSGPGELMISVVVDCEVSLEGYIDKSDYFVSEGDGVNLLEDWNDHVFRASDTHRVRFTLSAEFPQSDLVNVSLTVDEAEEL